MAGDEPGARQRGLAAYQALRPLGASELALVEAFDQSGTLLSAFNWLDWVFVQRRTFVDPRVVTDRVRVILTRLEHLAEAASIAGRGGE
jgi:hypothetical protein